MLVVMDLNLFRDLDRLRQTGNFSHAAERGNISQPAFSRRIKALEGWAGVQLVDRTRQPVKLTAAGEQILEAGLQAAARIEQERSQILEAQSLPDRYVVTFGTQHSIGWRFYPAWLQAFEEAFGPILSRLRADDLPNCMRDLKEGNVDFVIAYGTPGDRVAGMGAERGASVEDITIGKDRLIPVCKPDGNGLPMYDFASETVEVPYLRFGDQAPIGMHLHHLFKSRQITTRLRTVYENAMAGALRIRARDGAGVAWLPESLVLPDLDTGLLVRTGPEEWQVDLDIRMLRTMRHANRLTGSIWQFLAARSGSPLT
jgi:DNA-binding transcriptional LysR family regulator